MNQMRFQLPLRFAARDFVSIDLSVSNSDIAQVNASSSAAWEQYIATYLKEHGKAVAYGGYLEQRNLYQRSAYFSGGTNDRCIHLGVDFWAPAGKEVCAIYAGKVHSFQNNTNHGDYGPTILLEHQWEGEKFYSLYGHLSVQSLDGLAVGQAFAAGDTIGWLGDSTVNGDYAPHLHLQCIRDLEGNAGDYPGVCTRENVPHYTQNCPNPLDFMPL